MVSHAVWKTWPSGLSNDKNLGLRPRFLSTESLGPCFSHGTGDHDQILQQISENTIPLHEPIMAQLTDAYTVQCSYNSVNFIQNSYKRHIIARPLGRGMVCLLWIQSLIYILSSSLQSCMQYIVILDHIITELNCIYIPSQDFNILNI